jgi:hypothetical protein
MRNIPLIQIKKLIIKRSILLTLFFIDNFIVTNALFDNDLSPALKDKGDTWMLAGADLERVGIY